MSLQPLCLVATAARGWAAAAADTRLAWSNPVEHVERVSVSLVPKSQLVPCRHVPQHAQRQRHLGGMQPARTAGRPSVCAPPVGRPGSERCVAGKFSLRSYVKRSVIQVTWQKSPAELFLRRRASHTYCADCLSALRAGRVPKTNAIYIYLRALQKREPQWTERIEQVCICCLLYPWYNSVFCWFLTHEAVRPFHCCVQRTPSAEQWVWLCELRVQTGC